jgi:hypothetical protein
LASSDFDSDDLGWRFLIKKAERIGVRIFGSDFQIERAAEKDCLIADFLNSFLPKADHYTKVHLHGMELNNHEGSIENLTNFIHPDGFLYLHLQY